MTLKLTIEVDSPRNSLRDTSAGLCPVHAVARHHANGFRRVGRGMLAISAGLCLTAPLYAAPLSVRVVDGSGRPVRDAVVTYHPSAGARAPRPGGHHAISQKAMQFRPFLTIIPVGAEVSFQNFDSIKHHVYSFSPAKRFELKLFAKGQSRTVRFDKAGVIAVGCNIHDGMSAFILVTDSAWTARTNPQGMAVFADAPGANGRVTVWHPYLRAPGGILQQAVGPARRALKFSVRLRPPPPPMADY